jgi:hypothetical protein
VPEGVRSGSALSTRFSLYVISFPSCPFSCYL